MGLKETISKIIDSYGEDVTHRQFTEVYNDYGELLDTTYTDTVIKAVIGGSLDLSFMREVYGFTDTLTSTILIKPEVVVDPTDKFIIDGKEVEIKETRTIKYKGEAVVTIIQI